MVAQLQALPSLAARPSERSVSELLGELAGETSLLVRQEVKLASTELSHQAAYAARHGAYVAAGALLGIVALSAFLAALILALAIVMPLWAVALIVGSIFSVAAYFVGRTGVMALSEMEGATQTLKSIQETTSWAKQQIR
jgi:hypothetical protein